MQKAQLSGLQAAVMQVLWDHGEATAATVRTALLGERSFALTTVATVLSRLEKQGFATHRADRRQYVYRALINQHEVQRSMVGTLVERLFQGDPAALVSHLVHENEIDLEDLERLKALIEARQHAEEENDDE
jgi:BlaI family penicillinase repressor